MDDDHNDHLPPLFPHKTTYDFNSKILIAAIVSLSVVVVLVTLLHLYARYVLRNRARRGAAMHALALRVAHVQSGGEPPKTGLDLTVISSLPFFIFKRSHCRDDALVECVVCLSMLEDGETARELPNCKHIFHAECIDKWLRSQSTCPVCRTEARPWMKAEHHEPPAWTAAATAPSLESIGSIFASIEGMPDAAQGANKDSSSSSSRFSSFRRMLSRDRLSPRVQSRGQEDDDIEDMERQ
ncbi:RING-H2 finger protein ATL40-like [Rhodamnia argentea]|uniref:RING-type E3 ubiquitin transferase n=1 Tax=Rhodamnia argentea TaxID=178133 RepID=A0A8B8N8P8_9MYRT|nr:RING-H2 finger protein ATL40-like [Rhodamnia argentea]